MTSRPRRIVVVGGTHGNEKGGIWVVEDMLRSPEKWSHPGLDVSAILANPEAAQRNLRYVDRDLNRCFGPELANSTPNHPMLERRRSLEIHDQLCSDGTGPDLVVDLHNTTSNMGITWILTALRPWPLYLAAKAQERDHRVRILYSPESTQSNVFLPSLGQDEITVEIGPVAHGTHSHWAWLAARDQTMGILNDIAQRPVDFSPSQALLAMSFEYFETASVERYPVDAAGKPIALIHQSATGRDYQEFVDGSPMFVNPVDESCIRHHGNPMHPVFLGEAAYVESGIAYHATRRLLWSGAPGESC